MPASPLNTVGNNRSGDRPHSRVSSSQANGIASFLKYSPNEKFPSISKNVWWRKEGPTFSRSLCLPLTRMHFCVVVARLYARVSRPRNTSLNWFMPALVNNSVGSSCGTSDELGTMRWPFRSKNLRNEARTSFDVIRSIVRRGYGWTRRRRVQLVVGAARLAGAQQRQDAIGLEALPRQEAVQPLELAVVGNPGAAAQALLERGGE